MKALVTGAEEHQGLAVIRGLGRAGVPVIACGARKRSMGFASRFAKECHVYTPPREGRDRFVRDMLEILEKTGGGVIIAPVETTLAPLEDHREEVARRGVLGWPAAATLAFAVDKWKTMQLARDVGVRIPASFQADSPAQAIREAERYPYPVAIKPRGNPFYSETLHRFGFKVRYADGPRQLREILSGVPADGGGLLVQELIRGMGVCVASFFERGRPIVKFPYARVRELPITGGISVLRQSLDLDARLSIAVDQLLGHIGWNGVAMVEFKHDQKADRYVLMEINGRFQASTALSLDAGLNLPFMQYALYTGRPIPAPNPYRSGVTERWLRGDWLSLIDYVFGETQRKAGPLGPLPSRARVVFDFLAAFRPGVRYDEFKWWDWKPGIIEIASLVRETVKRLRSIGGSRYRRMRSRAAAAARRGIQERRLPRAARQERRRDALGLAAADAGIDAVVEAALVWLARAQDQAVPRDGGVARHYSLLTGWGPSYPETSGYIVPTLLACAASRGEEALAARAKRMLDWLVSIQFDEGAFHGDVSTAQPRVPVVFNTGQILLGLAAGVAHCGDTYRGSMRRAADWLRSVQDPDGGWRRHPSPVVRAGAKVYDTHVAWGLLEAERLEPGRGYAEAALANVRWALAHQAENGWFASCCLSDPARPLTHTLGYALRGVLEAYRFSRQADFLEAARRTGDGLLSPLNPEGFLPGRLGPDWGPAASWACLTGTSQLAICWLLLYQETGESRYLDAARRANRFVRRTIQLSGPDGIRGGVKGSFPVDGGYGAWQFLNWACKFTLDANLLERSLVGG